MTKLGIFVVTILAAAGAACDTEAWAAESVPTMASPAAAASAPKTCTGPWDFIETNCQLTWYGITVYGTIDAGFGWQSHGAPFDPRSTAGASYLIQRQNRSPMWGGGTQRVEPIKHWHQRNRADRRERLACLCSGRWLRPVFLPILRWTGIGCRQHRHPPQPAKRPCRFEPSRPVVQRPRLCRRQFADLRHPDRFPAELADA